MSKLIVLVGLPASGKSTLAERLSKKENATIVSSDAIREELFSDVNHQEGNVSVFETMNERAKILLSEGRDVIYDATNINRKRRIHLINHELKADEYEVYYMATPYRLCVKRNNKRERVVPAEVIEKMYKNLHIPTKLEGWDKVHFHYPDEQYERREELFDLFSVVDCVANIKEIGNHDRLFDEIGLYLTDFYDIIDVPQDSSYHSFSISRHTFHVIKNLKAQALKRRHELLLSALFHDLGKGFCKSFYNYKGEKKRYASFIGHENVSAQLAVDNLFAMGLREELVKSVVDLIQFHMMPMNMSNKVEKRLRKLLTEEQYEDLMILHEADKSAK